MGVGVADDEIIRRNVNQRIHIAMTVSERVCRNYVHNISLARPSLLLVFSCDRDRQRLTEMLINKRWIIYFRMIKAKMSNGVKRYVLPNPVIERDKKDILLRSTRHCGDIASPRMRVPRISSRNSFPEGQVPVFSTLGEREETVRRTRPKQA